MPIAAGKQAQGKRCHLTMTPSLVEATEKTTAFFAPQFLQLCPKLKEFTGGEKDGGEGLNHQSGKLEVVLQDEKLGDTTIDVLTGEENTQLPDYERAFRLEQASVGAEQLEQAEHELLEVGGGGGVGGAGW